MEDLQRWVGGIRKLGIQARTLWVRMSEADVCASYLIRIKAREMVYGYMRPHIPFKLKG